VLLFQECFASDQKRIVSDKTISLFETKLEDGVFYYDVSQCIIPSGNAIINFKEDTDLKKILEFMRDISCKGFIIPSEILNNKKITVLSKNPVTASKLWDTTLAILNSNGLILLPEGNNFYKVVKKSDAKRHFGLVIKHDDYIPFSSDFITYISELRFISKGVIKPLLKNIIDRDGYAEIIGQNVLVIADVASNIKRVKDIIEQIDVPDSSNTIHIVDLLFAEAIEILPKLIEIFDLIPLKDSIYKIKYKRQKVDSLDDFTFKKILADERTNKLIIISSNEAFYQIKEVIKLLDVELSKNLFDNEVHVYELKNADSQKLASTLSKLSYNNLNSKYNKNMKFKTEKKTKVNYYGIASAFFEGDIKITSDESTNSLVVIASSRDYNILVRVIEKLDKPRILVYIEGAILDLAINDSFNMGFDTFGFFPVGKGSKKGIMLVGNPGGRNIAKSIVKGFSLTNNIGLSALGELLNGTIGYTMSVKDFGSKFQFPPVSVILKFMQIYGDMDVLSRPSITVLDNEKAVFKNGERIPVVSATNMTGNYNSNSNLNSMHPLQNIEYKDVELKFIVTPHVNIANRIRMEIEQDISDLGQEVTILNANQWRINTKSAKTTVVTSDGQTIILGGLIHNKITHVEEKVPILGNIPIVGYLFKNKSIKKERKNLILVLTPWIVRTDSDYQKIYNAKIKERKIMSSMFFSDRITDYNPNENYKMLGPISRIIEEVNVKNINLVNSKKNFVNLSKKKVIYNNLINKNNIKNSSFCIKYNIFRKEMNILLEKDFFDINNLFIKKDYLN